MNKQAKLSEHLASPSVASLSHLSDLNGLRLSPHFTLGEMTKTSAKGVDNTPPHGAVMNLKNLCENWLERLREEYNRRYALGRVATREGATREGQALLCPLREHRNASPCVSPGAAPGAAPCVPKEEPIVINSGYRSEEVNKAIGGVPTSNHLTGCAVDIRVAGMEQLLRYAVILLDIADGTKRDFDELLLERNKKGGLWLHFAVRPSGNRRKIRLIQTS